MNNNTAVVLIILMMLSLIAWCYTLSTIIYLNSNPYVFRFEMDDNSAEVFKLYFENKTLGVDD